VRMNSQPGPKYYPTTEEKLRDLVIASGEHDIKTEISIVNSVLSNPPPATNERILVCENMQKDCPEPCRHRILHSLSECKGLCPKDKRSQICSPHISTPGTSERKVPESFDEFLNDLPNYVIKYFPGFIQSERAKEWDRALEEAIKKVGLLKIIVKKDRESGIITRFISTRHDVADKVLDCAVLELKKLRNQGGG